MICRAFVFARGIDPEHLSEILGMDALTGNATIEAFDKEHLAVGQRLKFLGDALKFGLIDKLTFWNLHADRCGQSEVGVLVFRDPWLHSSQTASAFR